MTFSEMIFFVFSATTLFGAFCVITVRNPVHATLFLVLTFFNCAVIWMMLEAEFLALTLVLVYVGAVMVLFLFVVMMLDIEIAPLREGFIRYLPIGVLVGGIMVVEMFLVVGGKYFGYEVFKAPMPHPVGYSNTQELGSLLYTEYLLPFELAAVILVVAMIAAISLTMRKRAATKYQDPAKQVRVKREDRIRIVKMEAESRDST